jgi:phospho-N-acetylmuramoyl-pentapeptide-transferase
MVFAAYVLIGIWENNQNCASTLSLKCYDVRDPLDLAVVAAAAMGACFGFLWWNASPAKIFMGDTGSLALGGALAGLAITTRTELLVVILGGLFVVITLSVDHPGRRPSSPPANASSGWRRCSTTSNSWAGNEVTIVIRFWIIAGSSWPSALGIFYAEWVVGGIK